MTDDSRLSAFAVPGWEAQAAQFSSLIRDLANTSNTGQVSAIEKQIQQIQREKSGWLIGFFSLLQDDPHVRFYGALTLTVKINSQWDSLNDAEDGPNILLDSLRSRYIQLANAGDHAIVLRKLASSLTAYCIQPAAHWELPIRDLLVRFGQSYGNGGISSGSLAEAWQTSPSLPVSAIRALLWFCSTWIEEVSKFDAKTLAGSKVYEEAARNQEDLWCLISSILRSLHSRSGSSGAAQPQSHDPLRDFSDQDIVEITQEAINTALSWTKAADNLTSSNPAVISNIQKETVQMITACFWVGPLAEPTLEYLSFVVESAPHFQNFIPKESFKNIIQSSQVAAWLESLATDGDAPEGVRMATFIDALVDLEDLSSADWVLEGSLSHVIPILHALLKVPGTPGVDNSVASIALDVWTRIADGLNDWTGTDSADEYVKSELEKVIVETFPKTLMPDDELSGEDPWDQDERTKFNGFCTDYEDFLLACLNANSDYVVNFVHQNVIMSLENDNWAQFESSICCLRSLSEVISHDVTRDPVWRNVFDHTKWGLICASELAIPLKAIHAMVNLIAMCTRFLQRNETYLIPCMEFLFSRLSDESHAYIAAEAIQTLCNSRRSNLIPALPQFFSALQAVRGLHVIDQRRIFGSVACIIQALPSEESKVTPLKDLLQVLFQEGGRLEEMKRQQDEETIPTAVAFIKSLAAIGRGLRAPDETVVSLDEGPSKLANFWISGPGAEVQGMILQALLHILQEFPSNEVTAAACEVFKAGYTEADPFPFRFAPSISAQFLVPLIQKDNVNAAEVLATACSFLASHAWHPTAVQSEFEQIIGSVCQAQRELLNEQAAGRSWADNDFGYSSLDLLESILLRYCGSLMALRSQTDGSPLLSTIFEFALLCLRNPDTLPRRSATKFWATAYDLSGYNSRLGPEISPQWDQMLQPVTPHFVAIILQLISGECARSEIEAIAIPLRRFVEKQSNQARVLMKQLIEDPQVLPASAQQHVDSAARQGFVQKVMMLRGAKKTDSFVREFWIACRGANFAYTS